MDSIINFLTKPNEANMAKLSKKDDSYKIVLIVIVFTLFPVLNSVFTWFQSWALSFIFNILWDLVAEWFFVLSVWLIGRLLSWKWKIIDIFFAIALANIILLITNFLVDLFNFIVPNSVLVWIITAIIALLWFIWYIYVWVKGVWAVQKFWVWITILQAFLSFVLLALFYMFVVVWVIWFLIALF